MSRIQRISAYIVSIVVCVHGGYLIYRIIHFSRQLDYAWYVVLNNTYDQAGWIAGIVGLMVVYVIYTCKLWQAAWVYLPGYTAYMWYWIHIMQKNIPYMSSINTTVLVSIQSVCILMTYACAIMAGLLGFLWLTIKIIDWFKRKDESTMHTTLYAYSIIRIHRYLSLIVFFMILAGISHVVTSYYTQGILWQHDRILNGVGFLGLLSFWNKQVLCRTSVKPACTILIAFASLCITAWMMHI